MRRTWVVALRAVSAFTAAGLVASVVAAPPVSADEPAAAGVATADAAEAVDDGAQPAGSGEATVTGEAASCVIGASAKPPSTYVNGGQRYYQAKGSFWNTCRQITAVGEVALQRWTGSSWGYVARSPQFVIPNGTTCCWYERWATGSYCIGDYDLYRTRSTFIYENTSRAVIGAAVELVC